MGEDKKKILLDINKKLTPEMSSVQYIEYQVDVPENVGKVGLILNYLNPFSESNSNRAVIFVAFYDPHDFRGQRMNPGGRGDVELELWTSNNESSEGAIPGKLPSGKWTAVLDIRDLVGETDYSLKIYCETSQKESSPVEFTYPEDHVIKNSPGWYKGELHAHSTESDGKFSVKEVIDAAIEYDLDYYSLTDHTTCSQWHKLANLQNDKMAIIRSMEITSHVGHANLHGVKSWVNAYIDRQGWNVNQAAEEVHRQGGLFCVNHAFSGHLAWKDFSLDWNLVDLEEIYHNLEGANNSYQLSLWDQHLNQGYQIVGVGGIDSHNPYEGIHELGQVVTWIYADELSEQGIINGLRRGQVYISRGPEIRFSAANESGDTATMWESLNRSGKIKLSIDIKWEKPYRMFIIKNGLILDVLKIAPNSPDWALTEYIDDNPIDNSYYRIELHDDETRPPYSGIIWRDYSTMRVLTNPIWINRKEKN